MTKRMTNGRLSMKTLSPFRNRSEGELGERLGRYGSGTMTQNTSMTVTSTTLLYSARLLPRKGVAVRILLHHGTM
jgi:hypothetical protein